MSDALFWVMPYSEMSFFGGACKFWIQFNTLCNLLSIALGVLRMAQWEWKSHKEQKGKSQLDFDFQFKYKLQSMAYQSFNP